MKSRRKLMYLTPILLTVFLCPTVVKIQKFISYIHKQVSYPQPNKQNRKKSKNKITQKLMCSYFGVLRVCDEVNITKHAFGRLLLDPVFFLFCSTIYLYVYTYIFLCCILKSELRNRTRSLLHCNLIFFLL